MKFNRPNIAFFHDVIMAAISFVLALFLRLGDDLQFYPDDQLIMATALFTTVAVVVFRSMRMYRGVWRYASLNDLLTITKSVSLTILVFMILMFAITRLDDLPRSLPIINWFVLMALLGGPRFLYRLFKDRRLEFKLDRDAHLRVPILLVGAGDSAELFIRDIARTNSNYRAVGIVSGSESRVGRDIHGIEILGTIDQIPDVVNALAGRGNKPQRLVMTSERIERAQIAALLDHAENMGLTLARLPSLSDFKRDIGGDTNIKPIDVEDLLGRPQTPLDRNAMGELVKDRRVLITGAGGSIGSELVRQISALGPAHMTLVDHSEYNLFTIDLGLKKINAELPRAARIGDVRDRARIDEIFNDQKPDLVFHAAALKHVPMVEANMAEGVRSNVLGTVNVADAARKSGVKTFVQISTDKAVNPTSVMGATKRIAEMYCQALDLETAGDDATRFVTVRFGNVLGSTGSVVELFRGQLADGGPLTVTHPEMTRYFMTVREAVELVLQASAMGSSEVARDGKIFVLDMGEPVRIIDLAKQMIRLAGLVPDEDIAIEFTGPRPGEKLFEEILHGSEELVPTHQPGLLRAAPRAGDLVTLMAQISHLGEACKQGSDIRIIGLIADIVPEFAPPGHDAKIASAGE